MGVNSFGVVLSLAVGNICWAQPGSNNHYQPTTNIWRNDPGTLGIPTTNWTNDDFPIDLKRDYNCEACQMLTHTVHSRFKNQLLKYSKTAYGRKSSAASEVLQVSEACSYSTWKELSDHCEFYHSYDLSATCKVLLGEIGEELEDLLVDKDLSEEKLREEACKEFCQDGSLIWREESEHITNRELKASRNTRMSAEMFERVRAEYPNLMETESGMLYSIINQDKCLKSKALNKSIRDAGSITAQYNVTFANGFSFDNTIKHGSDEVTFDLSRIVPGVQEMAGLMYPGCDFLIYMPSELAYGTRGAANAVGPNMAIIFRIQLSDHAPPTDEL
eukprot:GHVN01026691.1.p1 GENE.GHVN01026691.1~~GHVN01026691.1.p1  ORF type:complete len:331 (-),score=28.54 GHVN01026691.1:577-1569(-)